MRTPRLRRMESSSVPVNGVSPWIRRQTMSAGAGPSSGTTSAAGVPCRTCPGFFTEIAMIGLLMDRPA